MRSSEDLGALLGLTLIVAVLWALVPACDGESERERAAREDAERSRSRLEESLAQTIRQQNESRRTLRDQAERSEARLAESLGQTIRQQEESRRALQDQAKRASERENGLKLQADTERVTTQAAEDDFWVASAIAVSCAVVILLLVGILVQERRARRALAEVLRFVVHRRKEVRM